MKNVPLHFPALLRTLLFQKRHVSMGIVVGILTSITVLLSACGNSPIGGAPPTPVLTQVAKAVGNSGGQPQLTSLHMFDTTNGWATTSTSILHTTSSPVQWDTVTPPALQGKGPGTTFFFSSSQAWTVVVDAPTVHILRTSDSGQSWQEGTFSVPQPYDRLSVININFANAQDGWILVHLGNAAGTEYTRLYRTTDGGQNWSETSKGYVAGGGGYKSGISFLSGSTGWLTGYNGAIPGLLDFYVTHDGGTTWRPQDLQRPAGANSDAFFTTTPPIFFNGQDGVMRITWSNSGNSTPNVTIYVTHDGSSSWNSTTSFVISDGNHLVMSFYDVNHGWLLDTGKNTLYATSNAGQNWTTVSSPANNIKYIDFISSSISNGTGWAVPDNSALFTTPDGGDHWAQIPYTVS